MDRININVNNFKFPRFKEVDVSLNEYDQLFIKNAMNEAYHHLSLEKLK